MITPIVIREFFLVDGDKLVSARVPQLQRVVRRMIKQSRKARVSKKKRPSQ